jgi:hypothetical protein
MDPLKMVSKETETCVCVCVCVCINKGGGGQILSVLVWDFSILECSEVHELEQ